MDHPPQSTTVPVRVYQIDDRIMVAAPLPGLEPEDITVTIAGPRVTTVHSFFPSLSMVTSPTRRTATASWSTRCRSWRRDGPTVRLSSGCNP
jgi:hypothetical protein